MTNTQTPVNRRSPLAGDAPAPMHMKKRSKHIAR